MPFSPWRQQMETFPWENPAGEEEKGNAGAHGRAQPTLEHCLPSGPCPGREQWPDGTSAGPQQLWRPLHP